jgi:hypothetical protein
MGIKVCPYPALDGSKLGAPSSTAGLPRPFRESPWRHLLLCGFEFMDAGAAARGVLHGCLVEV